MRVGLVVLLSIKVMVDGGKGGDLPTMERLQKDFCKSFDTIAFCQCIHVVRKVIKVQGLSSMFYVLSTLYSIIPLL